MPDHSNRSQVKRGKDRAAYDETTINQILDDGTLCHVGISMQDQPFVIPMSYVRDGDTLIMHGSPKSRLMQSLSDSVPICVTVTHLDGLVLARSTYSHSVNFRSVVMFGTAHSVTDPAEKRLVLDLLTDHITPGRTKVARAPSEDELKGTAVVRFTIEEASAKFRTGPPNDAPADLELDVWAGVIPLSVVAGEPIPAPDLKPGIEKGE